MSKATKRALMSQHEWFSAAAEADLWMAEGASDGWPDWLIRETRRLGARRVQGWLCDESVSFGRYDCGLSLAEYCGLA